MIREVIIKYDEPKPRSILSIYKQKELKEEKIKEEKFKEADKRLKYLISKMA